MATATRTFCRLGDGPESITVLLDYDDADYQTINDDGDPDDYRLIRFYGTNTSLVSLTVTAFRPNGSVWATRTIAAGDPFEVTVGGAVKYETDIPHWSYRSGT